MKNHQNWKNFNTENQVIFDKGIKQLNNDKCFREATYQKLASKSNIDEPLLRSLRPTAGLLHLFLNAPLEVWGNSVAYYGVPSVKLFHG